MKKWILLILTPLLLFIFTTSTYAIDLPNRPDNGIYDPSHYLNETVAQNLANVNKDNDTQIGEYIVDHIDSSILHEKLQDIGKLVIQKTIVVY